MKGARPRGHLLSVVGGDDRDNKRPTAALQVLRAQGWALGSSSSLH